MSYEASPLAPSSIVLNNTLRELSLQMRFLYKKILHSNVFATALCDGLDKRKAAA